MAKCVVFTERFQVFADDNVFCCSLIFDPSAKQFYGIQVGLRGGMIKIEPQSDALAFLNELKSDGFYSDEQWARLDAWLDRMWPDKKDILLVQRQKNMQQIVHAPFGPKAS